MRFAHVITLAGLVVSASSCATIIKGTSQEVSVDSRPTRAQVEIRQRPGGVVTASGSTPLSTSLKREKEYDVEVKAPGYEPARVFIRKEFEFWVLGNILCGGLIGGAVDLITGAFWRLQPDELLVTLVPVQGPVQGGATKQVRGGASELDPPTALTGLGPSSSEGSTGMVALFVARDDAGNLRMHSVPLIPEHR